MAFNFFKTSKRYFFKVEVEAQTVWEFLGLDANWYFVCNKKHLLRGGGFIWYH